MKKNFKKVELSKCILSELASKRVKKILKFPKIVIIRNFREIFFLLIASSDRIYLESSYFLKFSLTSMAIGWWRNFLDNLNHLPTVGCQTLVGRTKFPLIASFLPLPTKVLEPIVGKWFKLSQKFLHWPMAIDVKENLKK